MCFSKKNVYKWAKHGFATSTLRWEDRSWSRRLSCKEKVLGSIDSKEVHADNLLGLEKTHHYWFLWKRCNCKVFPFANSLHKIHLFYWIILLFVYVENFCMSVFLSGY